MQGAWRRCNSWCNSRVHLLQGRRAARHQAQRATLAVCVCVTVGWCVTCAATTTRASGSGTRTTAIGSTRAAQTPRRRCPTPSTSGAPRATTWMTRSTSSATEGDSRLRERRCAALLVCMPALVPDLCMHPPELYTTAQCFLGQHDAVDRTAPRLAAPTRREAAHTTRGQSG